MDDGANTLKVLIEDVTRPNQLLDEAMGRAAPRGANQAPGPVGPPPFPATVRGPGGKVYSFEDYEAARKKFQAQQASATANAAYGAFFGPPPLPKKGEPPNSVMGEDGKRVSFKDYFKARDAKEKESQRAEAERAKKGTGIEGVADSLGLGGLMKGLKAFGGEGLSTAAGGAGIAGAVLFAAHETEKSLLKMKGAVDGATMGLEALAANDLGQVKEGMHEFGKSLAGTVPILGDVASANLELVHTLTSLPEKVEAAFLKQAKTLAPYSGAISAAESRAYVANLQADMREADQLGPDMERLIQAESELRTIARETLLPIKKFVLNQLANRLEVLVTLGRFAENLPTILKEVAEGLGKAIAFTIKKDDAERDRSLRLMLEAIKKAMSADDNVDVFDRFLRDARGAALPEAPFAGK
jgi:hypothetical protein